MEGNRSQLLYLTDSKPDIRHDREITGFGYVIYESKKIKRTKRNSYSPISDAVGRNAFLKTGIFGLQTLAR
jgi:hypothetical protein